MAISCQTEPPSRLADLRWKISQEAISRINSPSFLPSHYTMALATNREQYDKGAELENRRFALQESSSFY